MVCNTCGVDKDISLFRKRSDNGKWYRKCKDCKREYSKKYYQKNREEMMKKQRLNYKENAESRRKQKKEYGKTQRGIEVRRKAVKKWVSENRRKSKACQKVNDAVDSGTIPHIKEKKCKDCGEQAHHYHHWSYLEAHWLDVVPLCRICHKAEHKRLRDSGIIL